MPIKSHSGPQSGRAIMQQALLQRLPSNKLYSTPVGGGGIQAGSPIPVYLLEPQTLASTNPLISARLTSWRYPVVGGSQPSLAEIREQGSGTSTFSGLSYGLLTTRVFEASGLAEQALAGTSTIYEPRLLEVPALQFAALWLVAASDQYFIPLLEGTPPGSAQLGMVDDVVALLKARASASLSGGSAFAPRASSTSGPTN